MCVVDGIDKTIFKVGLAQKDIILNIIEDRCLVTLVAQNISFTKKPVDISDKKSLPTSNSSITEVSLDGTAIVLFLN